MVSKNLDGRLRLVELEGSKKAMQHANIHESLAKLDRWVASANWKAYDTFDGLSSPYASFFTLNHPLLKQMLAAGCPALPRQSSSACSGIKPRHEHQGHGIFCAGLSPALSNAWQTRHIWRRRNSACNG